VVVDLEVDHHPPTLLHLLPMELHPLEDLQEDTLEDPDLEEVVEESKSDNLHELNKSLLLKSEVDLLEDHPEDTPTEDLQEDIPAVDLQEDTLEVPDLEEVVEESKSDNQHELNKSLLSNLEVDPVDHLEDTPTEDQAVDIPAEDTLELPEAEVAVVESKSDNLNEPNKSLLSILEVDLLEDGHLEDTLVETKEDTNKLQSLTIQHHPMQLTSNKSSSVPSQLFCSGHYKLFSPII